MLIIKCKEINDNKDILRFMECSEGISKMEVYSGKCNKKEDRYQKSNLTLHTKEL